MAAESTKCLCQLFFAKTAISQLIMHFYVSPSDNGIAVDTSE